MKLQRLTPVEAWVLNQYVMCGKKVEDFPEYYEAAKAKLETFIEQYKQLNEIDLYLATSMRTKEDVERAEKICNQFEEKGYLVYNPANNCDSSRNKKSDLEKHMMEISKGIIIDAGTYDTGGKFIEAGFFKFGLKKPVFMLAQNTEKARMYSIYHDWHPSAITLGVHVSDSIESLTECINNDFNKKPRLYTQHVDDKINITCQNCKSILARVNP